MSLNWNISKIANKESVCRTEDGSLSAVTHVIIMGMMAICTPDITTKNWREVARRFHVLQSVNGALLCEWRDEIVNGQVVGERVVDRLVTSDDIQRHIGLSTNSTCETPRKFDARMAKVDRANKLRSARLEQEAAASQRYADEMEAARTITTDDDDISDDVINR